MASRITSRVINDFLKNNQIEFYPSQRTLCIPFIDRIYQKMINNIRFNDIKICDKLIIDGHHRYFSSLLAGQSISKIETLRTSATVAYDWDVVVFTNDEWDTNAKIRLLNEDDAFFNNIPLEKMFEITK